MPFLPDAAIAHHKQFLKDEEEQTRREQAANPDWKPATGSVATHISEPEDKSMRTGAIAMGLGAFFGLLAGGLKGLLLGAALGFVVVALVLMIQEGSKD